MSSNLELLEQCIANLEAKKDELKGENAELKNENAKLKWIIEKNVRRDAENAKHKMRHLRKALVMGLGRRIGKRNCCMNQLPRTYLVGVSNETTFSVIKDKKSQSHKKRKAENIVQDVFDFIATSVPKKNHMTEISMTARHKKSDMDNPSNILQNLAYLIQKA
ncbi:hypothetical protein RhiirA1_447225 [Rhizophagus irregularis]|uniref:Uncharacterized protein n=1 Tax=Rhizophagus irregularis TaxID=588596 RepID=A0A2N0QRI4_9GLOM|nr:hypothetical protein RhiirA1_447225 [Rhizophagus irregularis]